MSCSEILSTFCREFRFPAEAEQSLLADLSAFTADERAKELLDGYVNGYTGAWSIDHGKALDELSDMADTVGVSPYAVHMIFYILLSPKLRELYREKGIADEVFRDSMDDLRCKLYECKTVCDVWGSFVAIWFSRFFNFTLYGLGRLEFAPLRFRGEYEKNGNILHDGDFVIDVHIPSKGRLPYEAVEDAYRRAAKFFEKETGGKPVFFCESWMLDPGHDRWLDPVKHANLLRFQHDFDLTRTGHDSGDLWRIFGRDANPSDRADIEALPEKTSLQRAYKTRLLAGDLPGWGEGVYFFVQEN